MKDQSADSPYRLGYFEYTSHMHEGMFRWHEVPNATYSFGGRYSRLRYRHPFFVLENRGKGTCFIGQLAYSGGYRFSFDVNHENYGLATEHNHCYLGFAAETDGLKPQRVLAPGETINSPELLIGMVNGDMDMAVNGMHDHIRRSVMMPQPRGAAAGSRRPAAARSTWTRSAWTAAPAAATTFSISTRAGTSRRDLTAWP